MNMLTEDTAVTIDGFDYNLNENGYLHYEGKPLGALKWGHPALVAVLGEHYSSSEAWDAWFRASQSVGSYRSEPL